MTEIYKTRIFLKKGFRVNLYPLMVSNFMQNIKKMRLMRQYWPIYKKVIFQPKMTENGQNLQNENFPKKRGQGQLIPTNGLQLLAKKFIFSNCSAHFCSSLVCPGKPGHGHFKLIGSASSLQHQIDINPFWRYQ